MALQAHDEPDAPTRVPVEPAALTKVSSREEGQQVWRPLRDLWLTNTVMAQHGTAQNAAYAWDANEYAPVLALDGEDEPTLFFAKARA